MNRILATTAIAFAFCAPTLAHAASDFVSVMNDTGCDSRYSDEKKANIATQYLGQPTTVTGIVTFIDNGKVGIRVLRTTLSHDVQIYLANPKAGYNLEKDRMITVQFVLKSIGGCFWPYTGDQGITEAEARAAAADADTAANDARVAIERDARAKAEATRARIEADAKAKVEVDRSRIEAEAKAKVRMQIENDLRAKAEADAKAKAEADALANIEAAERAKDEAAAQFKATEDARLEAEAIARKRDAIRAAKAADEAAARDKAEADARVVAEAKAEQEAEVRAAKVKADATARAKVVHLNEMKARAEYFMAQDESAAYNCNGLNGARRAKLEAKAQYPDRPTPEELENHILWAEIACDIVKKRGVEWMLKVYGAPR